MVRWACAAAMAMIVVAMPPADANELVLLHAAGSLRGALTEVADAFTADSGSKVEAKVWGVGYAAR